MQPTKNSFFRSDYLGSVHLYSLQAECFANVGNASNVGKYLKLKLCCYLEI